MKLAMLSSYEPSGLRFCGSRTTSASITRASFMGASRPRFWGGVSSLSAWRSPMERAFLCNIVEDAGSGLEQFQTPAIRRGGSEGLAQRFELLVESIHLAPCRA